MRYSFVSVGSNDASQETPSLGIDSEGNIYIVLSDERNDFQNIYFSMSEDGGATFNESKAIDQNQALQNRPSLYVDFNHCTPHITWSDTRQGICYLHYTKSIDNGESISPIISVYEYPPAWNSQDVLDDKGIR